MDFHVDDPRVTANSDAVASITEVSDPGGEPMIGNASLTVNSVAPNNNGQMYVEVNIDYDRDITFRLTFFVNP